LYPSILPVYAAKCRCPKPPKGVGFTDPLSGTLKRLREAREDVRPTFADAAQTAMDFHRRYTLPNDDTHESRSAIWAKLALDDDLGRYAESPHPFDLDQSQRDTLLANARKDAAGALANSKALLRELRALTHSISEIARYLTWAFVIVLICYWWKSGFKPWG
jgi:hypothetical protein